GYIVLRNKKARDVPALLSNPRGLILLADSRRAVLLLDDAGRLAAEIAQVIKLGAADLAGAHDLDPGDHGPHHEEDALHAFAVGDLAHREALVESSAGTADADALIGLHTGAVTFDDLHVDDHGVARSELRDLLVGRQFGELLFFELLNEVH